MIAILIVEDDRDLGKALSAQLIAEGFEVAWCQTQKEFLLVDTKKFAAAVIDINLPDASGFDLVKKLDVPVILMTALNTPENRLQGLELGAVDFIPKPFLFKELRIKLDRLLASHAQQITLANGVVIDLLGRTIEESGGSTTFLNDRELKILKFLIEKAPAVISRDEILNHLFGEDDTASHRSIDNVIVKLRQLLKDEAHEYIKSARGVGYQWVGGKHES
jgi:two-component system, OmpR family, phosphate regulon response regulator PhoB